LFVQLNGFVFAYHLLPVFVHLRLFSKDELYR